MNFILLLSIAYFNYATGADSKSGPGDHQQLLEDDFEESEGTSTLMPAIEEAINYNFKSAVILADKSPYIYDVRQNKDILFACPDENYLQNHCLYIKEELLEKKKRKFIDCNVGEFHPFLVNTKKKCGSGNWYSIQYKVCKKPTPGEASEQQDELQQQQQQMENQTRMEEANKNYSQPEEQYFSQHKHEDMDDDEDDDDTEEKEEEAQEENQDQPLLLSLNTDSFHDVEVFSFCFDESDKKTLYTKHKISVQENKNISEFINEEQRITLTTDTCDQFNADLSFWPDVYKKSNQQKLLDRIYSYKKEELEENRDFLIPQTLIPTSHVALNLSRGLLDKYYNISPLWNSKERNWKLILVKILFLYQWNEFGIELTLYTGTYGVWKFKNQNAYFNYNDHKIGVPAVWWILVKEERSQNTIIFAMDNVPKGYESNEEHKLCKDNKCPQNLNGIEGLGGYCCEVSKKLLEHLNLPHLRFNSTLLWIFNK